ncbi:MAG: rod shape-determining protein MreC, partial [Candidatus Dojkabacteria bacterium]
GDKIKQEQLEKLQAELAEVELVFSRYQDLKDELGEGYEREYGLIPALVIGRESGNVNSITINKGSTDGVEQGSAVVVDGYLLGRVEDVSGRYSLVSLLIDTSTSIPVKNVNESLGILKAQGGNQLLVDQILPGKTIEQGQPVFTSGLNSQYPPDLLVGEVSTIQADSREPTVSVELSSEISWGEIDNVTVLKQL